MSPNSRLKLRAVEVLLVEDSPSDALMTKSVLKKAKLRNVLHIVEDGEQALDFLYQRGEHDRARRPDLILLDLNLPRKDGREVLAEIKNDDSLKSIPVIVLTTSKSDEDVLRSYQLHANCFVPKPFDFGQFASAVASIEQFWFNVVALPRGDDNDR